MDNGEEIMEPDPEPLLTPPWKQLVKIASGWDYGSKHTHEEIAEILGVDYGTPDYYANVNAANSVMTECGKRLKNIHDQGYRVLSPTEQIPEVVYDVRGVMRKFRYSLQNLNSVPVKELDETTKGIHERTGMSLGRTYSVLASGYNEAAQIVGIARPQKALKAADKNRR